MNNENYISLQNVSKSFVFENKTNLILDNINLYINHNQFITIFGVSGSGKTTLLNIIGGFDSPTSGIIKKNSDLKLSYVTQYPHFIDELNVLENLVFSNNSQNITKTKEFLNIFNCEQLQKKRINQLSGGEKQRLNLIRGLIKNPNILILDEPTSSLDYENKEIISKTINEIKNNQKISIILVTHDKDITHFFDNNKIYELKNKNLTFLT